MLFLLASLCSAAPAESIKFHGGVNGLSLDSRGSVLIVALYPNYARDPDALKVISPITRKQLRSYDFGNWVPFSTAFSIDQKKLYIGGVTGHIKVLDTTTWQVSDLLGHQTGPDGGMRYQVAATTLSPDPSGRLLVSQRQILFGAAPESNRRLDVVPLFASARPTAINEGCYYPVWVNATTFVAECDEQIKAFDASGSSRLLRSAGSITGLGRISAGSFWAIDFGMVRILDLLPDTGTDKQLPLTSIISGCSSGSLAIFGSRDGSIFVWNFATGTLVKTYKPLIDDPIQTIACSADGRVIAFVARSDRTLVHLLLR